MNQIKYDYKCKDCKHIYERARPVVHRTDGGSCPKCGSKNTIKI